MIDVWLFQVTPSDDKVGISTLNDFEDHEIKSNDMIICINLITSKVKISTSDDLNAQEIKFNDSLIDLHIVSLTLVHI